MSHLLTRRVLVAAGPAAVVGTSLPPLAAVGDAHLLALWREVTSLKLLFDTACQCCSDAETLYHADASAKAPEALLVRPDDDLALKRSPEYRHGEPTGREIYQHDAVQTAKDVLDKMSEREHEIRVRLDPSWPKRRARIREIIENHSAWCEARAAAWTATGMGTTREAADTAYRRWSDALFDFAKCPATTSAGLQLKVRIAMQSLGGSPEDAEEQIDRLIVDADHTESVALSIVRDMARMAELGGMGGAHA